MNTRNPFFKSIAALMAGILFLNPLVVLGADLALDAAAGGNASLSQAGNGVPVVNIATPNAKGLSHNRFNDYNVGQQGLILNNATQATQPTQLGGIILGNPNLAQGAAGLILNEVTGANPSLLRGYTEVAGQAAGVIVANPHGITCDGCGFINTPRVTLSTGRPVIEQGELTRFDVERGAITIQGEGLNATNIDQFDLITRSARINAELHANQLNIITGRNTVDANTLAATAKPDNGQDKPLLAIDSSALGGMYAGAIRLVGTESGVGVRLAGDLAASAGDIRIDASGRLTLGDVAATGKVAAHGAEVETQGQVYAGTRLELGSEGELINRQVLAARDAVVLNSDGTLVNQGHVEAGVNVDGSRHAGGDVRISGQQVRNSGTVVASRDLTLAASQELDNRGGEIGTQGRLALNSERLDNSDGGRLLGTELDLTVDHLVNRTHGLINSEGTLTLAADHIDNTQGTISSAGALQVDNRGELLNQQGEILTDASLSLRSGTVNNQAGQLSAVGSLDIVTGDLDNHQGQIVGLERLDLSAGQVANREGRIASGTDLTASLTGLNQEGGELFSQGRLSLDLNGGDLNNDGALISAPDALLLANLGAVSNRGGEISSAAAFALAADSLDNSGGRLLSDAGLALNLEHVLHNLDGLIGGQRVELSAGSLVNRGGTLFARDELDASVGEALDNSADGLIQAGTGLLLRSGSVDNRGGYLLAGDILELTVETTLDNRDGGLISAQGPLRLENLQALDNRGGEIVSHGPLLLNAGYLDNRDGHVISRDRLELALEQTDNRGGLLSGWEGLTLDGGSLDNRQFGTLSSRSGDLEVALSGQLLNSGEGALAAAGRLDLSAASLDNSDQGILSSGADQHLDIAGVLNNAGGQIDAAGSLAIDAQTLDNSAGLLLAGEDLLIVGSDLDNSAGRISANTATHIDLDGSLGNLSGQIASAGPLDIAASDVDNRGGTLASQAGLELNANNLDNSADGTLAANDALVLQLTGSLDNSANGLIYSRDAGLSLSADQLDNRGGTLQALGDLDLQLTGDLLNSDGQLISSTGDVDVQARHLDNRAGTLASLAGWVRAQLSGWLNNGDAAQDGLIQGQQLDLAAAGNLINRGGRIHALEGDATLSAAAIDNRDGVLYARDLLLISGASLNNSAGRIGAGLIDLDLGALLDNRDGIIESDSALVLRAASLDNRGGHLRALGTTGESVFQLSGLLNNRDGALEIANHDFTLAIGSLANQDGQLLHAGNGALGLSLAQIGSAGGSIVTRGDLNLSAASWTNSGTLQAGNLTLDVGSLTQTASGQLLASDTLTGIGGHWINHGLIASDGTLSLALGGSYSGGGQLTSLGDLTLTAASLNLPGSARIAAGGTGHLSLNGQVLNQGRITAADDLTLQAGHVNNQGTLGSAHNLTVTTATLLNEQGLIFSGDDMRLYVNSFTNRYADVFSLGSLLIARNAAESRASNIENISGSLESAADMRLLADTLVNRKDRFSVERRLVSGNLNVYWDDYCAGRGCELYFTSVENYEDVIDEDTPSGFITSGGNLSFTGNAFDNLYSSVSAAGNIAITTGTFNNVGAGGGEQRHYDSGYYTRDRDLYNTFINNKNLFNSYNNPSSTAYDPGQLSVADIIASVGHPTGFFDTTQYSVTTTGAVVAPAVIQAGGSVTISASESFDNSVVEAYASGAGNIGSRDTQVQGQSSTSTVPVITSQLPPDLAQQQVNPLTLPSFTLPSGENGLFRLSGQSGDDTQVRDAADQQDWSLGGESVQAPVAGAAATQPAHGIPHVQGMPVTSGTQPHKYLVETNPALTDLKQFMGSDYLLANMGFDPDQAQKRLGDGLYEQRLVREAVLARTGQRYLAGLTSDEDLFRYLMDNALASKDALGLSLGVSLTAEQVAALTHDIVWLEEHEVMGEKVLVPVLYLAQSEGRLMANGALIQGSDLTLISGGDLSNQGTLRARDNLGIIADNIDNSGLIEAGDRLALLAEGDLVNRAGGIIAGRDVSLIAGGDILNERSRTTVIATGGGDRTRDDLLSATSRIEALGDLSLQAGRDIQNIGGDIRAGGDASLWAGRDVIIDRQEEVDLYEYQRKRETGYQNSVTQHGASVEVGGNLHLSAGRDVAVIASHVEAGGDLGITAGDNLIIASAADEYHQYSNRKQGDTRTIIENNSVNQVASVIRSGGDMTLVAGEDLIAVASRIEAGGEAYLVAGDQLALLSAEDYEHSLYEKKSKGSFGRKSFRSDQVTRITQQGTEITTGGDLALISGGDQRYQAAELRSGGDLELISGGFITFEGVMDLEQESHEKSSSSWAWQSAKGKGTTDETLRQSQLIAQGELAIRAVEGLNIDIREIDQHSVSQTIDAMVQAEPGLAWLQEMEQRGDVDWRQVQEIHDSFSYSSSGLSGPAAMVVAIVVAYFTAGAASGAIGSAAGAGAGSGSAMAAAGTSSMVAAGTAVGTAGAGWANVALTAAATSAAGGAAVSTINNRGDLGDVFKDITASDALKGYLTTAITAGLTAGVLDKAFDANSDSINRITGGFELGTPSGLADFGAYLGAQGTLQAVTQTAILGGSLEDNLQTALTNQVHHLLQAATFNAVGDFSATAQGFADGSPEKIALHAVVGGLLSEATGGNFGTGALAAGANEALVEQLSGLIKEDKSLELAVSQLIGIAAATVTDGDYAKAAELAKNATAYNRQLHIDEIRFASDEERIQRYADEQGISEDQARQELLRVGAAMVDHGWSVSLDAAEALSAEALLFLQTELIDASSNLFQVTPEEYYDERLGLKELLSNREAVEALVRDIALVDPLAYRTHPEYFQEVMNAKGQGSQEGFGNAITATVDAIVWAAGAVACPSCAMEDLQAVWDALKSLPEELSYKGYLDTLHIMQGGGAEVIQRNAASSTELGAGLGLGAAATGAAARALILERIGTGPKNVSNKPLSLGSTGRSTPNNLKEKLAIEQAMSSPEVGRPLPVPMTDARWPASEGWVKMAQNVNGVEVHYVRNSITGAIDDFKFK